MHGLNPPQRAAVLHTEGPLLVLAGAGSGKTRVLTTRIAWLIQTGQVSPQGLIAVTFTNKAAKEMLTRIAAMLPINTRGMWVGTFHGLCNRLLRAHHRDAELPQLFQIMDLTFVVQGCRVPRGLGCQLLIKTLFLGRERGVLSLVGRVIRYKSHQDWPNER